MTQGYTKGVPIDTDPTMAINSNQLVPSQAAVVSYIGANTGKTITQFNVQTGGSSNQFNNVAPSAILGVPLISQGTSAQPVFGTALVAGGGTGSTSFNIKGIVVSGATTTSALTALTLTNGQIVIGSTAGSPAAATITAGTGIAITNGSNSISIANRQNGFRYNSQSTSTTLTAQNAYYITTNSAITLTLPSSNTAGDTFKIMSNTLGTGLVTVQLNAGQTMQVANTQTSSGGSIVMTTQGCCVTIVALGNLVFVVTDMMGVWTVN